MAPEDKHPEVWTKIELGVRSALREIQRGGILCVPKSLEQQQLNGAVRIVMRHLARECPELMVKVEPMEDKAASS